MVVGCAQSGQRPDPLQSGQAGGSPPQWTQRIALDGVRARHVGQGTSGIGTSRRWSTDIQSGQSSTSDVVGSQPQTWSDTPVLGWEQLPEEVRGTKSTTDADSLFRFANR
jgi:hypothetical protein